MWFIEFHKSYLAQMQDNQFTDIQKQCFMLDWNDCRKNLGPDIEGNILWSLTNPDKILGYTASSQHDPNAAFQMKKFEELAGLNLQAEHENVTILLEIMKYSGKDINLVEAFELFKKCHQKDS